MPSNDGTTQTNGAFSGDAGDLLFDQTHNDIDASHIEVQVHSGRVHIYLREAIWSEWVTRINVHSSGNLDQEVTVNSSWYDGDHRLRVWADQDGTSCDVTFSSEDW